MPNKSPVSGRSGAVRIQRLSAVSFAAAEAHGKRLDAIGKARSVIPDAPPLTTTGLDLDALYRAHVNGLQVQKSNTKALHLVLQFPTELMDGEDAETMLKHSRDFVASIFGDAAIFADRVDRDEKSRHVVDLFIAPKYEKQTKRQSKAAISTSKHLKELAEARGKAPNLRGQGQALQDAWFEYLRDRAGLNVSRGNPKKQAGDDWLTPEQLELERLREENAKLKAKIQAEAETLHTVQQKVDKALEEGVEKLDRLKAAEAALAPVEAAVAHMDAFKAHMDAYKAAEAETKTAYRITDVYIQESPPVFQGRQLPTNASITAVSHATGEPMYWRTEADTAQSAGRRIQKLLENAKSSGKELWAKVREWTRSGIDGTPVPSKLDLIDGPPPALPPKPTLAREVVDVLSMLDDDTLSAIREINRNKGQKLGR